MIKSMTGFGRHEVVEANCKVVVEMKSVNHRYLDLSIKMPKRFNFFESAIRNLIKQYIQRGKVDIFISYEDYSEGRVSLNYNKGIASEYIAYAKQMEEEFHITNDLSTSVLARLPEVFTMEQIEDNEEQIWSVLHQAILGAVQSFVQTREVEGQHLKRDIFEKLEHIEQLVEEVESRFPTVLLEYRAKLEEKVKELLESSSIDESRIVAEVTIFADKICVDEETVRLKSHIHHMKETLLQEDNIGRKLDFIAQEMNREANTILSKANDKKISQYGIDLKTEIEKVREQIQNIE